MAMETTALIIRDLRLLMSIGVYASEKNAHQPVLVNVRADVALPKDWQSDSYANVVCYSKMVEAIKAIALKGHIHLAETFAEMIAEHCLGVPGVHAVTVKVEKTAVLTDTAAVGVEIYRVRSTGRA
jgi:7,8-dihydroneopterin aldolase/epimerase/oxygenase